MRCIKYMNMFAICYLLMSLSGCHQPLVSSWQSSYPPQFDPIDPHWNKRPPKVDEVIPPSADTDFQVAINRPPVLCRYTSRQSVAPTEYGLNREDLARLLNRQQELLKQGYEIKPRLDGQIVNFSELLDKCQSLLDRDIERLWQDQSEQVYQRIIQEVLDSRQQKEYYHRLQEANKQNIYHGRSDELSKREVIWGWLFLSEQQKQKISSMYLQGLNDIQIPQAMASVLHRFGHSELDEQLLQAERLLTEIHSVLASHAAINHRIATQEEDARQALRETRWLESVLTAETDTAEIMKLRKQIADKKFEAEKLVTLKDRNHAIFHSYQWRAEDLASIKTGLDGQFNLLLSLHEGYLNIVDQIISCDGIKMSECRHQLDSVSDRLSSMKMAIRNY